MAIIAQPGAYHVNGSCTINCGFGALGCGSSDGVDIAITTYNNEIMSDERGPSIPAEVLQNGSDARITFELWKYSAGVLSSCLAQREGGVLGTLTNIGQAKFKFSQFTSFQFTSPVDGVAWNFPCAWIVDDESVQLNSQLKIYKITIRAVPHPETQVLYTTTTGGV